MKEYEELVEALVGMATITRPLLDTRDTPNVHKQKNIQHGICDLMEDAAVAIDELMKRLMGDKIEERDCAEAA